MARACQTFWPGPHPEHPAAVEGCRSTSRGLKSILLTKMNISKTNEMLIVATYLRSLRSKALIEQIMRRETLISKELAAIAIP